MAKKTKRINGVASGTPPAATGSATGHVVRSAVTGRFVISEEQAKKLEALKAAARQPTTLPHGF
ncbi:MAG: hypothetical protein M9891_07620 [Austwickia sp.]|nr:hypothetical protein [Actinomycetota bacterium]MCB1255329.1 hypothetical protein [Austwickia sp.]MCO5309142.1 hypothetical protein [Austwickia sp.]